MNIPIHSVLNRFRKELGIGNKLNELDETILSQTQKLEGFLNLMICSLDSRPIYAAVGGFKKECVCSNPDKCTCTPRFSDPDATTGRQLIKVNQNRYFVGYRKNTLNSKVSDQKVLLPSLERLKKIGLSIPYLIADKEFTYSVEENP